MVRIPPGLVLGLFPARHSAVAPFAFAGLYTSLLRGGLLWSASCAVAVGLPDEIALSLLPTHGADALRPDRADGEA